VGSRFKNIGAAGAKILSLYLMSALLIISISGISACTTTPIPPPEIIEFKCSPATVDAGGKSTLTWRVSGATAVSIDQGIGKVDVEGSKIVYLSASTSYTLTATNSAGSGIKTVLVKVSVPVDEDEPVSAPTPAPVPEKPAHPDDKYIEVSSSIWHYTRHSTIGCQYEITIRNRHDTWSIKNATLLINGTSYKVADIIKPYDNAQFYKVLECPTEKIIYDYEWMSP